MKSLIFKATAAVTVLAATAAATVLAATAAAGSFISTGFLLSPPFLWVSANAIIIWLHSSSRRRGGASSAAGHAADVLNAVNKLYPSSSDYEGFFGGALVPSGGEAAAVGVSKPKRKQPREARSAGAAARRADDYRSRVPEKPAGEAAATTRTTEARETRRRPDAEDGGNKKRGGDEMPRTVVAAAAAIRPEEDDGEVSLDSLWQSMLQRRTVRPVSVRKSETWGNDELPRLQRAAEMAVKRREMRNKSVSSAAPPPPPQESAVRQLGWRTRDVLVRAQDDLMRRAESLIRRHYEQLRLQSHQESSEQQRQLATLDMEQQRVHPPVVGRHGAAPAGQRLIHAGFFVN